MRLNSRRMRGVIGLLLWPVSLFYGAIALAFLVGAILPDQQPWFDHLAMALPPVWVLVLLVLADILPEHRVQSVDRIAVWGCVLVVSIVTLWGLGSASIVEVFWMDGLLILILLPPIGIASYLARLRSAEIER